MAFVKLYGCLKATSYLRDTLVLRMATLHLLETIGPSSDTPISRILSHISIFSNNIPKFHHHVKSKALTALRYRIKQRVTSGMSKKSQN